MKYIFIWLIRLYQKYLSPLKRYPTCRFTPTCSSYAVEAFMKRGFFAGLFLTVWRILRCNPFCVGGYDPVPEGRRKGKKNNEDAGICSDCDQSSNEIKTGENPSSDGTGDTGQCD